MKFLLFAFFGTGLSITVLNTSLAFPPHADLQECEPIMKNAENARLHYPKKVCNIDKSSINDPEKLSIFLTECIRTKGNWLLINSSVANYNDEILY